MTANPAIGDEIRALKQPDGLIYPAIVVRWAKANENSQLHRCFQWDDVKAAAAYRLEQARSLIQIHVVNADAERLTISLATDRANGGGYRDRDAVLSNAEMRQEALLEALADLERWQHRNVHFTKEFKTIFKNIGPLRARLAPAPPPPQRPAHRSPPPDQPRAET